MIPPLKVVAVHLSEKHGFSKKTVDAVTMVAGVGVLGDAHAGTTVQHVYDRRKDPQRPNLRQVHLLAAETLAALAAEGYTIAPGALGENVTTQGIHLEELPQGTRLLLGSEVVLEVTGLRQPCTQINRFQAGLMKRMFLGSGPRSKAPRAGVMAVVLQGGTVHNGVSIQITQPPLPHQRLQYV